MKRQADALKAKHLKKKAFNGIKKGVFTETAIYRKARTLWKALAFKRAKKYLTKIRRKTLLLTLAHKRFSVIAKKRAIRR